MLKKSSIPTAKHLSLSSGIAFAVRAMIGQAETDLQAQNTTASSRVRLGMPFSIALLCVGEVIARLEEAWPHICLRLIEGFSGTLAERLVTHQDDLAVFVGEPKDPRIESQLLGRERMCLVAPKNWGIANASQVTLKEACSHSAPPAIADSHTAGSDAHACA